MGLSNGTRLGPYEILSPFGVGGMGEVYRARDTRLERTVAIKVLPSHLSSDPILKQRFEREAKVISSLQHPHICTLYDIGSHDGFDFLVMECLEGQTLAERLAKGVLPLDQVLKIGVEIAEALDKAHREGIIHRDLKPGNIMLTSTGAKLMDFGLAKPILVVGASAGGVNPSTPTISLAALSSSPSRLTQQGTILGTFQYMAPEILQGRDADARSDIFSFGCVLYEMITGCRAFEGKSQVSVFAAILEKEPEDLRRLQPNTPQALKQMVGICLAKDPENRFTSAHDLRLQLQTIATARTDEFRRDTARSHGRELIILTTLLSALLVAGWVAYSRWKTPTTPRQVVSSVLELSAEVIPDRASGMQTSTPGAFSLSPDGRYLAFVGTVNGISKLWIRSLDGKSNYVVSGSEGAIAPFWSPDDTSVGFFSHATMKKLTVSTGLVTTICPARARSGAWGANEWIVFAGGPGAPMYKVSAQGGTPIPMPDTINGFRASFLPDGRHFLYSEWSNGGSNYRIKAADLDGEKTVDLGIETSIGALYAAGYVVYSTMNDLVAQRFDPDRLRLLSEPEVIVHGNVQFFSDWTRRGLRAAIPRVNPAHSNLQRWRIQPRFGGNGREINYISSSDIITSVDLSYSGGVIHPGAPRQLFKVNPLYPGGNPFDVSPDGKLFVVDTVTEQTLTPVHLIMNWDAALKK